MFEIKSVYLIVAICEVVHDLDAIQGLCWLLAAIKKRTIFFLSKIRKKILFKHIGNISVLEI